jgi:hypothetical protein
MSKRERERERERGERASTDGETLTTFVCTDGISSARTSTDFGVANVAEVIDELLPVWIVQTDRESQVGSKRY